MRAVGVNIGLVLACTFLLTGCATVVAPLEPQLVSERLPFVQDGNTSKEEVLRSLGEPNYRYEGGRILTYKMCYVPGPKWFPWGNYPLSPPTSEPLRSLHALGAAPCSPEHTNTLILVFGPDDLVERHSVVDVK
jgi:hypothetical protein